jgi:hypothetical protein
MNQNPYFIEYSARERYQNLLEQAETYRRIKKIKTQGTGWPTGLLASLGQALIALGQKLQMRAKPKVAGSI